MILCEELTKEKKLYFQQENAVEHITDMQIIFTVFKEQDIGTGYGNKWQSCSLMYLIFLSQES